MFVSRVDPSVLAPRLDAEHYEPALLRLERGVFGSGLDMSTLDGVRDPDATITYGIVQPGNLVASGDGVRLIRCTDLGDLTVGLDNLIWVSAEIDRPYKRSRVQSGDVLVGIAGSIGVVGVAPTGVAPANLNQSVARIRCKSSAVGKWVAAYLASSYGQSVLKRRAVGAVQQHLNLADLPDVPVPEPDPAVMGYVGSKVRQAESLRDSAGTIKDQIRRHFGDLHQYEANRRLGSWRQRSSTLREERADANHYVPPAVALEARLTAQGAVDLGKLVTLVRECDFSASKTISYFEIGCVDISSGCVWPNAVPGSEAPSRAQRSICVWDVLVSTVRPERKNVALVSPTERGQLVASSGFAVLRAPTAPLAAYVWGYLRSDAATEQLMRWNTGAAYPAIDDDAVLHVLVPDAPVSEMEHFGKHWQRIPELLASARALVTAARLLVEALIERKVTEAELIAAAKDPDADLALLSRLKADGLDGAGSPLFPDIDALVALLEQTQPTGDT